MTNHPSRSKQAALIEEIDKWRSHAAARRDGMAGVALTPIFYIADKMRELANGRERTALNQLCTRIQWSLHFARIHDAAALGELDAAEYEAALARGARVARDGEGS